MLGQSKLEGVEYHPGLPRGISGFLGCVWFIDTPRALERVIEMSS